MKPRRSDPAGFCFWLGFAMLDCAAQHILRAAPKFLLERTVNSLNRGWIPKAAWM
ncbi:hypothetical protein SAMN05444678_108191 [Sphingomonas sp. YR710]|nr:hypothetical protein SAMN05444678_108191 [Sphingomonas sp. YR710]